MRRIRFKPRMNSLLQKIPLNVTCIVLSGKKRCPQQKLAAEQKA